MQDVPQLQKCFKSYLYIVSWRAAVSFNLNDKKKIISYFISSLTNKVSFKKKVMIHLNLYTDETLINLLDHVVL